ncbi:diguanylate cyclase domain-containing protein [Telluria beijingensis]|uniref:diguanylate cyclase domain-containing protein n=1 Tax=Telluria beijingensis TaxID=3068633 RepID=UPI0027956D7B|nr:diguanylate cyclase [Massilia sp. REN29]
MLTRGLRLLPANLKLRMACVAAILVFAATLLATLATLAVAERGMKSVIGDQQYTMLASAASFMDDRIVARVAQIEALAASLPQAAAGDPAATRRVLEAQATTWKHEYLNLIVVDARGQQVVSLRSFGDDRRLDAAGRDYFERPMETGHGFMSQPILSRISNRKIVIISAPVFGAGGQRAGVLTASMDLRASGFLRQISALKPGGSGYLFLMTPDGVMIDHPDPRRLSQPIGLQASALDRAIDGFEGWTEATGLDGRPSIYAYQRLRTTGWILGARYPTEEAFAPLAQMRRIAIFGATGLALASGVLAWAVVFRLLAPLQRLRDSIRAIRHEGADIAVLHDARRDEIGELGNAFYQLMAERENAEGLRAASEKRLRLITDNLPVLIAYLDREQRFRFGNATFERWFGVTPENLVGMSIAELMGEDASRQGAASLEGAFAGHATTCQMRLLIQGAPRVLEGVYIPDLQPDGSVAGVYALKHDMTHVKEVEEQLTRLARVDTLTGLANRRSFNETLQSVLARAARHGRAPALAYLDVDHFKRINDSHGHGVGDEVLREFGERLRACVRASDTPARLSGDEFVVILEEIDSREEAEGIAAKIVAAMRAPFATGAGMLAVSASVGVALWRPGQDEDGLLAAADGALYAAKEGGRDRYVVGGRDPAA